MRFATKSCRNVVDEAVVDLEIFKAFECHQSQTSESLKTNITLVGISGTEYPLLQTRFPYDLIFWTPAPEWLFYLQKFVEMW